MAGVVARQSPGGLGEIVGAEREELRLARELVGGEGGAGQLDHGAQQERHRDLPLAEDLLRHLPDDQGLLPELDTLAVRGIMTSGMTRPFRAATVQAASKMARTCIAVISG